MGVRSHLLLIGAATLVAITDLAFVYSAGGLGKVSWLFIVIAGACVVVSAWKSSVVGVAAMALAASHAIALLYTATADARTFFGGAMIVVIAMYAWIVVTIVLAGSFVGGRISGRRHE